MGTQNNRLYVAGSAVLVSVGVVCLWWSRRWLDSPSPPVVPGLDAVLLPLTDVVWVPGIGVLLLAGGVTFPLHWYVPRSRVLRAVTVLAGGALLSVNAVWVVFPVIPPYSSTLSAIYNVPLTAAALLLLGVGTTGWVVAESDAV